jgi:hypothetical protein
MCIINVTVISYGMCMCACVKYDVNQNNYLVLIILKMQLVAQFKQHMNIPLISQVHG